MKVLLSFFTLLLSLSVQAQSSTQHMKFMGIPMDCDTRTFANKLVKEKGLKKEAYGSTEDITLKGDFSGYKDCRFFLKGEENCPISGVGVIFKESESFNIVHSQYQTLKSRLQKKYGEPISVVETFKDYEPSTDYGKLRAIRDGEAVFEATFYLEEGLIKLQILSISYIGYIQLIYYDAINASHENDKAIDDL